MPTARHPIPISLVLVAMSTTGCLDHPLEDVRTESISVVPEPIPIDTRRKVDILLVIDNSGSMGEEQAALAANFESFVSALELEEVDADYRIGITTTDDGNPWCGATGPESGALQLRSCREHLSDFVFAPGGGTREVDRRAEACERRCPESLATLTTLPSTTRLDREPRSRPWLERSPGSSNVPPEVTTTEAFACWGPQGINGCGYESPLESMRKALLRSERVEDAGWGFVRDDALLQVVFITDEADCSMGPGGVAAFDPDGTRTLWPDPEAPLPANGLCWTAGVACETGSDGRTHCEPTDLDAEGRPASGGDAVLHPLSRYIEVLQSIDDHKRTGLGGAKSKVLVSVIAGTPTHGGDIEYGPGADPQFAEEFGVGAGCRSGNGQAVPPVRLRALADRFTDEPGSNLFSICNADYSPALELIAQRLVSRLTPSCIDACVAGVDALVEGDLPSCVVVEQQDGQSREVETCARDAQGTFVRPEGEDLCVYAVTGDAMHPTCMAPGLNVELRFLRAPGASFGEVIASCEASVRPQLDCPDRV